MYSPSAHEGFGSDTGCVWPYFCSSNRSTIENSQVNGNPPDPVTWFLDNVIGVPQLQQDLQIMMDPNATPAQQEMAGFDFVSRMEFWRGLLKAMTGDGGGGARGSVWNLEIDDPATLNKMVEQAITDRAAYPIKGGAAAAAVANIEEGDGKFMSALAQNPGVEGKDYPPGLVSNVNGSRGGPQCAECQLALKIDKYAQNGGKLPDVIVIVEQQRRGLPACANCEQNVPAILGKYNRPIVIFNAADMSQPPYIWTPPGYGLPVA